MKAVLSTTATDELARQIVVLDKEVKLAARAHRWFDCADLEATRGLLLDTRYAMLRRQWLEREWWVRDLA